MSFMRLQWVQNALVMFICVCVWVSLLFHSIGIFFSQHRLTSMYICIQCFGLRNGFFRKSLICEDSFRRVIVWFCIWLFLFHDQYSALFINKHKTPKQPQIVNYKLEKDWRDADTVLVENNDKIICCGLELFDVIRMRKAPTIHQITKENDTTRKLICLLCMYK